MTEPLLTSISYYLHYAFFNGEVLPKLKDTIDEIQELQSFNTNVLLVINKVILNLTDESAEGTGNLLRSLDFNIEHEIKQPITVVRILTICAIVSYSFNEYEVALKHLDVIRKIGTPFTFHHAICIFYHALVLLELARNKKDNITCIKNAEECISILRSISKNAPSNFDNKVSLLEAELFSLCSNLSQAKSCYDLSIALSKSMV